MAIAACLGSKDTLDVAVADFAAGYADLSEDDHAALDAAAGSGLVHAVRGV